MTLGMVGLALVADHALGGSGRALAVTALYVGPDQILPLTSILGALVGILLIFWRYVVALASRIWQFISMRRS